MFSQCHLRSAYLFARFAAWAGVLCIASSLRAQAGVVGLDGKPLDPFQSSKGKVVVLVFVRTDCPIANRYAPVLQALSEKYAEKAAFWLVHPSRKESAEVIRKHGHEFGYKIPAVKDLEGGLVRRSQAQITPEAAVFDEKGVLTYHGRIDNLYEDFGHSRKAATTHELQDAIEAAIAGRPPGTASSPAVGCYISDLE